MEIGQRVDYLPAAHYATHRDLKGDYAWVIGRKRIDYDVDARGNRQPRETVVEMSPNEAEVYLDALRRHPNPAEEKKNLVLLRPAKAWTAVVTAIGEDGSVDLDVTVGNGFTLHERGVRVTRPGQPWSGHTCVAIGGTT